MSEQVAASRIAEQTAQTCVYLFFVLSVSYSYQKWESSGALAKLLVFSLALAVAPLSAYFGTQWYITPGALCPYTP